MKTYSFQSVFLIVTLLPCLLAFGQKEVTQKVPTPSVGAASSAPAGFYRPLPGGAEPLGLLQQAPETGPFNVDANSREQVREFYNAVYPTSDNIPEDSSADVPNCYPGTNSTVFEEAVLRRINWFRAMDGMPADVTFDTAYNQKAQQMALMISDNQALNHNPPPSWLCYTDDGASQAGGNQAEGLNGADAITAYIWEFGGTTSDVGHRRWILWPPQTVMGTGDVPGSGDLVPANLTWVFGGSTPEYPATRHPYCSWPPEGYIPYWVVFPYWSFSYPGAEFSNAVVNMKSNGIPVSVGNYNNTDGYGDNTLCWVPMGVNSDGQSLPAFPFNGTDTVYTVTVSNVSFGAAKSNFTYQVTLFDPAVPGTDYIAPVVHGTTNPVLNAANAYSCTAINNPNVTSYRWITSRIQSGTITENALTDFTNNSLVNFTFSTVAPETTTYPICTSAYTGSQPYCFHLCDPDATSQLLTLNYPLLPASNSVLNFSSMLGYATATETASAQVSTNGGASWVNLYSLSGTTNGNLIETAFHPHTISLSIYAGISTLFRFNYAYSGGEYYPGQTANYDGWSIESISISNSLQQAGVATNIALTTNITSGDLTDDAKDGFVNFTPSLWPSYSYITNAPDGSGNCFHMTHSDYTVQSLQLNETLIPSANASISFSSMLAYASADETARVQVSTNCGVTWNDLFAEAGCFTGDEGPYQCETTFTPYTLSLSNYVGAPVTLRFFYDFCCNYESFPGQADNYIGWNIENIAITNCQQRIIDEVNSTNFTFTPTQAGTYLLQPIPVIFSQFPIYGGTELEVTTVSNSISGITLSQPVVTNNEVLLNFAVTGPFSTFKLLQASQPGGRWTTNLSASLITNTPGSSYRFTTVKSGSAEFYRVQSP